MLNCTAGSIDDSNFSKPMPVIGLYIAAAALLCAILMAIDAGKGLWRQRYWIPSKYFSVDAASLTVVGVAIKLSVDLNSAMPSKVDQLAKLSTSAFICTMLANMLPSLGRLANGELLANTIALSILIITSIVNLCIQLNTGVIHAFKAAHIVMIVVMSLTLHECIASASHLPTLKRYLNFKFEGKQTTLGNSQSVIADIEQISMMVQSGCPHFVMARSLRCFSVGILCSVSASTFFAILIASIIHKNKFMGLNTCSGESDYKWSVLGILIAQTIAVVVGLLAPVSRLIYIISAAIEGGLLRRLEKEGDLEEGEEVRPKENKREEEGGGGEELLWPIQLINPEILKKEEVEEEAEGELWSWQLTNALNESSVFSDIEDKQKRPRVYRIKFACSRLLLLFKFLCESAVTTQIIISIFTRKSGLQKKYEISPNFLHAKGVMTLIGLMEKYCSRDAERYIDAGKRGAPQNLKNFLKDHLSRDLIGVYSFVNDYIFSLSGLKIYPNCWSLAVLTLTCVATALPNIDLALKDRLMNSVKEGLVYIKLVEDNVKGSFQYMYCRAAADRVWIGLDRNCSWLDINLRELACERTSAREVLLCLAQPILNFNKDDWRDQINEKRETALEEVTFTAAATIMHKVCQTMLQQDGLDVNSSDVIFEKLSATIADILGACFTNLSTCIRSICRRCPIENRREVVYHMLKVCGEIEEIVKILPKVGINIRDDDRAFLDEWRFHFHRELERW